jgi:hypothetical protein
MKLKIYGSKGYLVSVDFRVATGWKRKSRQIHDSNTLSVFLVFDDNTRICNREQEQVLPLDKCKI